MLELPTCTCTCVHVFLFLSFPGKFAYFACTVSLYVYFSHSSHNYSTCTFCQGSSEGVKDMKLSKMDNNLDRFFSQYWLPVSLTNPISSRKAAKAFSANRLTTTNSPSAKQVMDSLNNKKLAHATKKPYFSALF